MWHFGWFSNTVHRISRMDQFLLARKCRKLELLRLHFNHGFWPQHFWPHKHFWMERSIETHWGRVHGYTSWTGPCLVHYLQFNPVGKRLPYGLWRPSFLHQSLCWPQQWPSKYRFSLPSFRLNTVYYLHTFRNLHFLSKNSTLISRENCRFFWVWKTRENVVVLDFLAVDNFDFTRKIVKKIWLFE